MPNTISISARNSAICISDPEEAAERDRRMKAGLKARNFKPVPTDICQLGPGAWCEDTPHAGELSVQGVVETRGKRDRFDQAVGYGWMVIGLDVDPGAALLPDQLAELAFLGGRTVRIVSSGAYSDVVDVQGTYARWLHEIDANYVLLRPDFYVAATARTAEDLQHSFDEVMARIRTSVRGRLAAA